MSSSPLARAAQRVIVPSLRQAMWTYREVVAAHAPAATRWLDLGCGHALLPPWMADATEAAGALVAECPCVVGIDADLPALRRHQLIRQRVLGNIERLPFASGTFDLVTANMVVEHVAEPGALVAEIARVLVPGGSWILHTPNRRFYQVRASAVIPGAVRRQVAAWLEARDLEDVYPTHYRLNTVAEIDAAVRAHGLALSRAHLVNSGVALGRFGLLAVPELIVLRLLESESLAWARSNIIAVVRKQRTGLAAEGRLAPG